MFLLETLKEMEPKDWIVVGGLVAGYLAQLAVLKSSASRIERSVDKIDSAVVILKESAARTSAEIDAIKKLEDERHEKLDVALDEAHGTLNRIWGRLSKSA